MIETSRTNELDRKWIKKILEHYALSGRHDLPWKKNHTCYRIIVSEIMLQQTQVTRVMPKYVEWMRRYPTLTTLRKSSLKEILVLWQGLGYQRRAKALYTLAQKNTTLPRTFEGLVLLDGIGVYTASAVMAFAYNTFSHPVLETNIRTALIEEFHQGETEIHDGLLYDDLVRLENNRSVQKVGARIWYYALMDYGAHLKQNKISHNKKSKHKSTATPYKGSMRQLRAKVLFSITKGLELPNDDRLSYVLEKLIHEGYIVKNKEGTYSII